MMLSRSRHYVATGYKDALRARGPLAVIVLVVLGICLAVLILLGFRRGLVTKLYADIAKSPSASYVEAFRTRSTTARPFGMPVDDEVTRLSSSIRLVIPEITTAVEISTAQSGKEFVTLVSSLPDDPVLALHGAGVSDGLRAIVVTVALADRLGIAYESADNGHLRVEEPMRVTAFVRRDMDGTVGEVALEVNGVIAGDGQSATAYGHAQLLDWLEHFKKGRAVPPLGLPARRQAATAAYEGYLAFCERPYTGEDGRRLHLRGLRATLLEGRDERRRLCGLLSPHGLAVYWLEPELLVDEARAEVDLAAESVEKITGRDEVIIPWVEPVKLNVGSQRHRVVGVSVRARWLARFFRSGSTRRVGDNELLIDVFRGQTSQAVQAPEIIAEDGRRGIEVAVRSLPPAERLMASWTGPWLATSLDWLDGQLVELAAQLPWGRIDRGDFRRSVERWTLLPALEQIDRAACAAPAVPLAVTSAEHLSILSGWQRGELLHDPVSQQLLPAPQPNYYNRARIYAVSIDDVPEVCERVSEAGYAVLSDRSRVVEMQSYVRTVSTLAAVLGAGLALGGTVLIAFVFTDLTHRKRRDICIERLLGVTTMGVFIIVATRALVVWVLATVHAAALAGVVAAVLNWNGISCELAWFDFLLVGGAALAACLAAVVPTALYACCRLHPADAISEEGIC